jgi:hypothetical protein
MDSGIRWKLLATSSAEDDIEARCRRAGAVSRNIAEPRTTISHRIVSLDLSLELQGVYGIGESACLDKHCAYARADFSGDSHTRHRLSLTSFVSELIRLA